MRMASLPEPCRTSADVAQGHLPVAERGLERVGTIGVPKAESFSFIQLVTPAASSEPRLRSG